MREQYGFAQLMQRFGGIIENIVRLRQHPTEPQFAIGMSSLGNLTLTLPNVNDRSGRIRFDATIGGGAADVRADIAWMKALAEGVERYCTLVLSDDDTILASAKELGDLALDLDSLPRMSAREYADPKCPFREPDKLAPIRWVRGYSLTHERIRYVPAVMTHIFTNPGPSELFWSEISTGVAAHTDFATAAVSAICEVVERDAIALTWLARLPLARIEIDVPLLSAELAQNLAMQRATNLRQLYFDATTDLGIPTVYSLQLMDGSPNLAQSVACATAPRFEEAIAKTIREATPVRSAIGQRPSLPEDVEDFVELHHGAAYLGRPELRHAFDFLLDSSRRVGLSSLKNELSSVRSSQLCEIIQRLRNAGMEAVLVDLTTQEVRSTGLWVLRVVIPQLMPMSCVQAGRYLGHARLFQYPERAGFEPLVERDVNPFPQPFA